MKKFNLSFTTLLITFILMSCGKDSNPTDPGHQNEEISAKKKFVWNGLNFWYYWQQDVDGLADGFKENHHDYFTQFDDAEDLFNDLKFSEDRFSWFIEDYEKQEDAFKGISKDFGFSFALLPFNLLFPSGEDRNDIIGYVQYTVPDTPADKAGLKRGDLFTGINGQDLTENNYAKLLGNEHYELSIAEVNNNTISETGETVSMDAVEIHENPVYKTEVINADGIKVGYLLLNAFRDNYHRALNDSVGTLKNAGIDELVLDLRYNGGGAISTSSALASMISGNDSTEVFAKFTYGEKRSDLNSDFDFYSELPLGDETGPIAINKLNLDHVYILTGSGTASASEMVINGLKPYMDVTIVGEQTVGKDVGSITVYDSPPYYNNKENLNEHHKIAMQPIVVKLVNVDGEDYSNHRMNYYKVNVGFIPDQKNIVREFKYLEDLPALGDPDDPLLNMALEIITGVSSSPKARMQTLSSFSKVQIIDSRDLKPFGKEMYLPSDMNKELQKRLSNVNKH